MWANTVEVCEIMWANTVEVCEIMWANTVEADRSQIMWANTVEADRSQINIWRMRIACWTPKAKNTLSEYVILVLFSRRNKGCTNAPPMLVFTYIVWLVEILSARKCTKKFIEDSRRLVRDYESKLKEGVIRSFMILAVGNECRCGVICS
jgi:hypothetical protein